MLNLIYNLKQKKYDKSNVYGSILNLHQQCAHAYQDVQKINIPKSYQDINKILVVGMGGSGLGARAVEAIYKNKLKYPILRLNDYNLPNWVDKKTLVIVSSYSGSTEEVVMATKECVKKKLKWIAIAKGSKIKELALKHQAPIYEINPKYNPSNQPRMAIGYALTGLITILSKLKVISLTQKDLDEAIKAMKQVVEVNKISVKYSNNQAKQLAKLIENKQVIFSASEHLAGIFHTVKNQMNENAKHLAHRHDIPELNHHLMEGLQFPHTNQSDVVFILVQSDLYHPRNQKRVNLTKKVIEKNKISTFTYHPQAKTRLAQALEAIQFGAFVNHYLTLTHGLDPSPIPWVDYFKQKLA